MADGSAKRQPLPGAARSDGVMTPIDPSFLSRLVAGIRYTLTGRADGWFGPSQPLPPVAQEDARGRQFDYPTGYNTVWTPRYEGRAQRPSFEQLRNLADACDLVRLAIETRKDQICRLPWQIQPRDVEQQDRDQRCDDLEAFLAEPDRVHEWSTWLRLILEELLVIDAPAVYPRFTRGGGIYSLDVMDGSMFKLVMTTEGRRPEPPEPAYQQIVKGVPAVDYTSDELLYMPRNPRANRLYGYSPVEQIIVTINTALRKQLNQLQYFTDGSAPDTMIAVPDSWQPEQIQAFQSYWDALLAGNTAERRRTRFISGGMKPYDTRDRKLKDDFDEWIARVVCFCFSLPPTAFVRQMNRATAETSQDTALEEGMQPIMQWVETFLGRLISRWFGCPDLRFAWQLDAEVDQVTRANIDKIYLDAKVITPDEVREDLGLEPLTAEQKDELNPAPPPMLPGQGAGSGGTIPGQGGKQPPASKLVKKNAERYPRSIARGLRYRGRAGRSLA